MGFVLSMLGAVGGFKQLGSRIRFMLLKDGSGRRAQDRLVEVSWVARGRDRAEERVMTRVQLPAQAEPALYTVSQVTLRQLILLEPLGAGGAGIAPSPGEQGSSGFLRREQRSEPRDLSLSCVVFATPVPVLCLSRSSPLVDLNTSLSCWLAEASFPTRWLPFCKLPFLLKGARSTESVPKGCPL